AQPPFPPQPARYPPPPGHAGHCLGRWRAPPPDGAVLGPGRFHRDRRSPGCRRLARDRRPISRTAAAAVTRFGGHVSIWLVEKTSAEPVAISEEHGLGMHATSPTS